MSQLSWSIVGQSGRRYDIGVYHGNDSGHLLVHCNFKILLIDFNVRDTRSYSFFIEDEFCELEIVKEPAGNFTYGFDINKTVDTPLNRVRNKMERKYWLQTILFFAGFLVVVVGVGLVARHYLGGNKMTDRQVMERLSENSEKSVARMEIRQQELFYAFVAKGKVYDGKLENHQTDEFLPVESGDEFEVSFMPSDPDFHQIDFNFPSKTTLEKYRETILNIQLERHPELDSFLANCWVSAAYELKGVQGWADFYYQNEEPARQALHNRETYLRLVRDVPFQQQVKEKCWE